MSGMGTGRWKRSDRQMTTLRGPMTRMSETAA